MKPTKPAHIDKPLLYHEASPYKNNEAYRAGGWRELQQITHDDENIHGFFGEYRWLSNFGNAIVFLDGIEYGSVERAYQAAKWKPEDRAYFATCKNDEAIAYNRTNEPNGYENDAWHTIKSDVMRFLLVQKFNHELNPEMTERLVATGERDIEETNWWGDVFWGRTLEGEGENNLGKILMDIRSQLQEKIMKEEDIV